MLLVIGLLGKGYKSYYKKDEPKTPLLNIKVEDPPTPQLTNPTTLPSYSCYCSLDPNDFKNWGNLATASKKDIHFYSTTWASGIFTSLSPFLQQAN